MKIDRQLNKMEFDSEHNMKLVDFDLQRQHEKKTPDIGNKLFSVLGWRKSKIRVGKIIKITSYVYGYCTLRRYDSMLKMFTFSLSSPRLFPVRSEWPFVHAANKIIIPGHTRRIPFSKRIT